MRFCLLFIFLFISTPAFAETTILSGDMTQGGLVMGTTDPGATLYLDGKLLTVAPSGRFVFGFGRDSKPTAILKILYKNGESEDRLLEVSQREYPIERVDGLATDKVTPSPEALARINAENAEIARIRSIETGEEWYLSGWQWPAKGRVSGVYGSQRVLNGIPKRPHFGLDIAASEGTEVLASTDGTVRMAEADLYYTGGTVMIDHGYGLISVYSHLSALAVKEGQFVQKGEKIGEVGSTGRSTGAHLDWRLNWFDTRLDPQLLLEGSPGD
jgi:murein DD-endopeptidase MepM/ murein hydrolase activator NlpD|tara:strand:+ start:247 stop:1059 length:813 start_codon:yes stop_codon:yes gene_type:complete